MSGAFEQLPRVALRVNPCREILDLVLREDKPAAELINQIRTNRLVGEMVGIDPSRDRDQPRCRSAPPLESTGGLVASTNVCDVRPATCWGSRQRRAKNAVTGPMFSL